jgi:hypothetical protein
MMRTIACAASIAGALFLATPAVAAPKSGGAAKSSINLAQPAGLTATAAGWPRYGDSVSFDVATSVTAAPWVNLQCSQSGAVVAVGWASYALGAQAFGLYSPSWSGGDADCDAFLVDYAGGRWKQLASTDFHVSS